MRSPLSPNFDLTGFRITPSIDCRPLSFRLKSHIHETLKEEVRDNTASHHVLLPLMADRSGKVGLGFHLF